MFDDDDAISTELEILQPHVAAKEEHIFVSLDVYVVFPATYPGAPAEFTLAKPRGLDDDELVKLEGLLKSSAKESAGYNEVHAFTALQTVADFLSERNAPNPCPVCFETVDMDAVGHAAMVGLKPCLHVLHADCYKGYLNHLHEKRRDKEDSLLHREGAAKAARLALKGWATCPVCRVSFDEAHVESQLSKIGKDY